MPPLALPGSFGGWFLLAFGALYTIASLWYVLRAWRTLFWPSTTGRIGHAASVRDDDGVTDYITYSYKIGPDLLINDQVAVGP